MLPFATFVVFYLNDLKIWRPSYLVRKRFCLIQREVKKSRNYLSQQYCLLIIFFDFLVCEGKFFRILMSFFDFEITMHVQLFWEFDVVFTKPNQKSASRRGNQHLKFCLCRKGKNQPPLFLLFFILAIFFCFSVHFSLSFLSSVKTQEEFHILDQTNFFLFIFFCCTNCKIQNQHVPKISKKQWCLFCCFVVCCGFWRRHPSLPFFSLQTEGINQLPMFLFGVAF